jgi:membrane protein
MPISITTKLKNGFNLFKDTASEWSEDNAMRLGASIAYYTAFSLAPLIVIAIAIAGFFFGAEAAQGEISSTMEGLVGKTGADAVESMVKGAQQKKEGGVLATVLGIATLLFGASGVFVELKSSLNEIWDVETKSGTGVWGWMRTRFLSFAMVFAIAFLLLVSLMVTAMLSAVGGWMESALPGGEALWQIVNMVISFAVVAGLFALLFKYLPEIEVGWRDVLIGAVVTAALFTIGKYGLGVYLGKGSVGSVYGAAGSLAIVLLWVYYSALIFLFGAEFTQVYARRHGSHAKEEDQPIRGEVQPELSPAGTPRLVRRGGPERPRVWRRGTGRGRQ